MSILVLTVVSVWVLVVHHDVEVVLGDLSAQDAVLRGPFYPGEDEGVCELVFTQSTLVFSCQHAVYEHQGEVVTVVLFLIKSAT